MATASENSVLLRGARIIAPDYRLERGSILIRGGRIAQVSDSEISPKSAADSILDLSGLNLFPGFIDIHIHGAVGVDVMTASAEDLRRASQFLAERGVTGWLPTLVPAAKTEYENAVHSIQQLISEQTVAVDARGGARVLGVHYEGPFVSTQQCGALHSDYFQTFSGNELDSLPTPELSRARLITVAPEIKGGVDLVRELKRRGWIISIGHTRADAALLDQAHEAGAQHMTHFMNAMPPLHHRSPGPVAWGLMRDDVTCDFIADGVHLDPLMLRLLAKLKGCKRLLLISDAITACGMGDGEYDIWGETITVKNGRTSNAHGTIAGSVISLLDAVRMMLSLGIAEVDVARMAATNPARLLGLANETGSIEEGKRADLVALDRDGNVVLTLVAGVVAYQR